MAGEAPIYIANQPVVGGPAVATQPVPVPQFPNRIGEAVAEFGKALGEFGTRAEYAGAATQAMRARTGFMTGMARLTEQYRDDHDPVTAAARFAKDLDGLQQEQLAGIGNAQLRASAQLHMTVQGLQAYRQMRNTQMLRQRQMSLDDLRVNRDAYLANAQNAGSPAERDAITDNFAGEVDLMHATGFIGKPNADAALFRFRRDLAFADAKAAVAHDPNAAAHLLNDDKSFPWLDAPSRGDLLDEADARADALPWADQTRADAAAFKALGAGTLNSAEQLAGAPVSGIAKLAIGAALRSAAAPSFDPQLYADLLYRSAEGETVMVDAALGLAAGKLDKRALQNIQHTGDQFDQDVAEAPWRIDQRRDLIDALRPQAGQSAAAARLQLEAAQQFDAYLEQNPQAGEADTRTQMTTLAAAGRAAAAEHDRFALDPPPGVAAPRGAIDGDDIASAAARIRNAFEAGELDTGSLVEQTNLLRGWANVINGSGSK